MTLRITGGMHRGRKIASPKGKKTRPTLERTRQTVFDILGSKIEDADFLDICAGSGAMGIEALSRGAKHATFIEKDFGASKTIQENLETLELCDFAKLIKHDAIAALKKLHGPFDIIYADPPYIVNEKSPLSVHILAAIDDSNLLSPSGILIIEDRTLKDHPLNATNLTTLTQKKCRPSGDTSLFIYGH